MIGRTEDPTPRTDGCWSAADRSALVEDIRDWLWLFLGRGEVSARGARATAARLLGLSEADLRRLCAVHFLLSPEVAEVVDNAAAAAARTGARSAIARERGRGALRGQPDWAGTLRARSLAGGDPSLYASALPQLDETYVLALHELLRAIRDAARVALAAPLPDPPEEDGGAERAGAPSSGDPSWHAACARAGQAAARLLAGSRLVARAGPAPAAGDPRDRRPPPPWWTAIVAARALHHRLVETQNSAALVAALAARAIEPAPADLLFEVWATLAALHTLEARGWSRAALHALGAGRNAALACYSRGQAGGAGGQSLAVYAQHTPVAWRRASRYAATFQRYGLAGGMRRPDLVIEAGRPGRRRWLLIEVKRTVDPTYIADSVYKVLGYLADFAPALQGSPEPQALLLVWRLPSATSRPPADAGPVVVADASTYREVLGELLTAWAHGV